MIVETQQDILETKAVLFGARRCFVRAGRSLPLQVQVSLDTNGRMLLGTDVGAALAILEGLRADVKRILDTLKQNGMENSAVRDRMGDVARELDRLVAQELELMGMGKSP